MGNRFSSAKFSIAECDRCAQRYKLKQLRYLTVKTKPYQLKVCPECWDPDHPQLQLGMYPVDDPQGVREPRPDISYTQSGSTGLQITPTVSNTTASIGYPSEGSRDFQWGWNPVGGSRANDAGLTPNYLVLNVQIGTVTIVTT